ncbi:MAG: hypothetical protein F6J97_01895 [Leptolyngbya sp. SIO4C1]|nr:hypothetical protein [Leptolyngbya sp. SIO4C1]
MTPAIIFTLIYSALAIIGGIIGYVQARSKVSLLSGIISGILLFMGVILMFQGNPVGLWLSLIVSLVLVGVFIGRLVKTKKLMPAGLMVIVGVVTVIALLTA